MRRPEKDLDLALRMSSEGMSATSIARAIGVHVSTVTRWGERAASHLRRFSEDHLVVSEPTEVQIDELRVGGIGAAEGTWAWSAIEGWSRVWLASAVERRTLRATRRFLRGVEDSCSRMVLPTVFATDEFKYYAPVINKVFGPLVAHVEVKNRYANGGIARTTFKLRNTPDFRYDIAHERSEDSKRPNTSYVERLNLFERRGVSYLHRRTPGRARKTRPVADVLEILRAYYNFIKPHQSLRLGAVTRTPAMQAGVSEEAADLPRHAALGADDRAETQTRGLGPHAAASTGAGGGVMIQQSTQHAPPREAVATLAAKPTPATRRNEQLRTGRMPCPTGCVLLSDAHRSACHDHTVDASGLAHRHPDGPSAHSVGGY